MDILNQREPSQADLEKLARLTDRQWGVFVKLANGESIKSIAEMNGFKCSYKTAEAHAANIKKVLGIKSMGQLRVIAVKIQLYFEEKGIERVEVQMIPQMRIVRKE